MEYRAFPKAHEALGLGTRGMASFVGAGGKTSLCYRLAHEMAREGKLVLVTTTTKMMRPTGDQAEVSIFSRRPEELLEEARWFRGKGRVIFAGSSVAEKEGKVLGFEPDYLDMILKEGPFDFLLVEADGARGLSIKAPNEKEPVIPSGSGWVVGTIGLDVLGRPLGPQWAFRWELLGLLTGQAPGSPITPETIARLVGHPRGLFKGCPKGARKILFLNKADLQGGFARAGEVLENVREGSSQVAPLSIVVGSALRGEEFWRWEVDA
jgi:probable selenium-dependent hydroxylase accessory protein YqeC